MAGEAVAAAEVAATDIAKIAEAPAAASGIDSGVHEPLPVQAKFRATISYYVIASLRKLNCFVIEFELNMN